MDWGDHLVSRVFVFRDITDRNRAEEQIRTSLREKEVLLKEIHHRVKNDLQIVSSLLHLQSRFVQNEKHKRMLTDSQNRIKSMALIHEKLYQSDNPANLDFTEYITTLAHELIKTYSADPHRISLTMDIDIPHLELDHAIACGLIINELVSNALKYAFPDDREGEIHLSLHTSDGTATLEVSDDGVGLPADFSIKTAETLGLSLVDVLAHDQLDGELSVDTSKGTAFSIKFQSGCHDQKNCNS
jgi:two-component sensor histidine kinase